VHDSVHFHTAMQTDFISVYSSIAARPCSRPTPDCL
jgi:hypothetical protein